VDNHRRLVRLLLLAPSQVFVQELHHLILI
jgi:hypothetical protein